MSRLFFGAQQTVKELVDNAIDACRLRSSEQDAPTVRVVLRRVAGTGKGSMDKAGGRRSEEGVLCLFCFAAFLRAKYAYKQGPSLHESQID